MSQYKYLLIWYTFNSSANYLTINFLLIVQKQDLFAKHWCPTGAAVHTRQICMLFTLAPSQPKGYLMSVKCEQLLKSKFGYSFTIWTFIFTLSIAERWISSKWQERQMNHTNARCPDGGCQGLKTNETCSVLASSEHYITVTSHVKYSNNHSYYFSHADGRMLH